MTEDTQLSLSLHLPHLKKKSQCHDHSKKDLQQLDATLILDTSFIMPAGCFLRGPFSPLV